MAYDFSSINILIIESSHEMCELTKSVLMSFGIRNIHAAYGFEEGYRSSCRDKPDLIVMDWLEDPMNGLHLTKKIRTDPHSPNPFVPIILMSGFSLKKRVLMARDSGITCFMAKPYTAIGLYKKIEYLVEYPKAFVKCDTFFGPDRRNKADPQYKGTDLRKRSSVEKTPSAASAAQVAKDIQERSDGKKS